jgi:uncharacterized sulfatase
MTKRSSRFLAAVLAACLGGLTTPVMDAAEATLSRPNVVCVLIDDMGWGDLSCFGGRRVQTPHIDRLAAEGVRFERFYVAAPICSPSRVALTTGQYPQRHRITSYLEHRASNARRGMAQWLEPTAPLLARQLQQAGYATGHFGKWHMGGQRDVDDAPPIAAYGFEASLTNFEGMGPKLLPLTLQPGQSAPGKIWQDAERLGGPVTWMQRAQITGGFVDAAIAFIDQAQRQGRPFYVNVWPDDVHSPYFPPIDQWADTRAGRYDAVLAAMDAQLAKLFDRIRHDPQLRDTTLLVLCSDNGHEAGAGSGGPLKGAKTWLYEGGIRSPLIVWGPGLVAPHAAGTTNRQAVIAALDVNRSLYAVTGAALPPGLDPGEVTELDGEDLSATLLGRADVGRRQPLCFRRPPDRPGFGHGLDEDNPDLAVVDGRWKYLVNFDESDPQLYDLAADVGETTNLIYRYPARAAALRAELLAWHAALPPDATTADPSD